MLQYTPWLITALAIVVAIHYAREANKCREIDLDLHRQVAAYAASNENLRRSADYFKDQNNRLRFLVGLDHESPVPSDKVIVLERKKHRAGDPLKPKGL